MITQWPPKLKYSLTEIHYGVYIRALKQKKTIKLN